jgi:3-oxoacyl-[acyl-carrier protein] reductase
MSDRYQSFALSGPGGFLSKQLGLPQPPRLRRYEPGQPVLDGPALVGGAAGGRLGEALDDVMVSIGAEVLEDVPDDRRLGAIVYDATGIESSERLHALYEFFHPVIRKLKSNGRVVVLGTAPEDCSNAREATAQRALEGFTRSVAKEVRHGSAVQLVYVKPGAEGNTESTLRFLLGARSAYVSGQVIRIAEGTPQLPEDWDKPLDGKVVLVTGASRGIGEAIATTIARDGAHVVALDVPQAGDKLTEVANRIEGSTIQLDITDKDAPETLAKHLLERHGGVDVVVHNAGVTRDKTLGKMDDQRWSMVLDINLSSQERINDKLLEHNVLRPGGTIVSVSSQSGIAGNAGQTNYGTSKAGVIGMVQSLGPQLAGIPATANAVAPGFIETEMTAAMPTFTREAGRRLNSMVQGGLPVDVAETISWLASPASAGVNGQVVRVDGQSLIGA